MKVWDEYINFFTEEKLKSLYLEHVVLSSATGIDNMSHKLLWPILDKQLQIIKRKVIAGNYNFTKYKLKLISKGRSKSPREISIPTIRDKITLRALCEFLGKQFSDDLNFIIPQVFIKKIKKEMDENKYENFIKLDVENFYPSIKHEKLISSLKRRIRDEKILGLVRSAIRAPTVTKAKSTDIPSEIGVPQGLSISNILAAIFLSNVDKFFCKYEGIVYYRYVDDVLVFCKKDICEQVTSDILSKFRRLGLKVYDPIKNPDKSSIGLLGVNELSYLGYIFRNGIVTARSGSIERLRESLLAIFTGFKYSGISNDNFLEWRLNLRITGCIFQKKSKGWLFFFSEINDEKLLHSLDHFLKKLCIRFKVNINLKNFVRAHYQIQHHRAETTYIPNFDEYDEVKQTYVLNHFFKKNTDGMTTEEIKYHFNKRISKQVKDIETDIQDAGY